jgi:PleD family two-component response regulator
MTDEKAPLILIADDDSSIRSLLKLAIQSKGYQVEEAANGEECLAKYARCQPDIVLLDAVMPVMDGFTCCQRLRSLPGGAQIPILMLTFLDDRESIDRAFQTGATDYLTKPIHWAVLFQRVQRLLSASETLIKADAIASLHQANVRSLLIAPIFAQKQLWGLLCAHKCNGDRVWEKLEIERFSDLAKLLSLAI